MDYSTALNTRLFVFTIAISLTLPVCALHEDKPKSDDAVATDQSGQNSPMEEITVIGQELILDLRQQIYLAEDRAFKIFNQLNENDLYDVVCVMEARTGSVIKRRMCHPNFYHRATQNNALEFLGSLGGCVSAYGLCASPTLYAVSSPSARNEVSRQFPIFKEKVKELALENPDLHDAMQDLFELTEELNAVRNSYHGTENETFLDKGPN